MAMKQPGTDFGERGETGEREPKGAKSSDSSGEKGGRMINGIGMGQKDATGRSNGGHDKGEFNTGRSEGVCYAHTRKAYQREDKAD